MFGVIVVVWIFPIVSSAKTIGSHLHESRKKNMALIEKQ